MIGKKKKIDSGTQYFSNNSEELVPSSKTIIGRTIEINGEVKSNEDVTIEGKVYGKIEVGKTLTIGRNGYVNAEIKAKVVRIYGMVEGDIVASGKVEIVPDGKLYGNIKSPKIAIAEGAIFKGNVDMAKPEVESKSATITTEKIIKENLKPQDPKTV